MTLTKPKSSSCIEVWRHEVSASFTPSENQHLAPPLRQPSFWKKILRRDSKSSRSGTAARSNNDSEAKDGMKTEMYDPAKKEDERLGVPNQERERGEEGSSVDLGSADSAVGGLEERRDRLERATKLLTGVGSNKEMDGKREKPIT